MPTDVLVLLKREATQVKRILKTTDTVDVREFIDKVVHLHDLDHKLADYRQVQVALLRDALERVREQLLALAPKVKDADTDPLFNAYAIITQALGDTQ